MPVFDVKLDISNLQRNAEGAVVSFTAIGRAADASQRAVAQLSKEGKAAGSEIAAAMKNAARVAKR